MLSWELFLSLLELIYFNLILKNMKFFNKKFKLATPTKTVKILLFSLFIISANSAFSQSEILQENPNVSEEAIEWGYGIGLAPCYKWKVAEHINGLWTISAIDAVSGSILDGTMTVSNLDVNIDGFYVGRFNVVNKWGYGTHESSEATVGVTANITVAVPGFPDIVGGYTRSHVYKL